MNTREDLSFAVGEISGRFPDNDSLARLAQKLGQDRRNVDALWGSVWFLCRKRGLDPRELMVNDERAMITDTRFKGIDPRALPPA